MGVVIELKTSNNRNHKPYHVGYEVIVGLLNRYLDDPAKAQLYLEAFRGSTLKGVPVTEDMYMMILDEEPLN